MNHIKSFNEASYNTQDIPKKFYLSGEMNAVQSDMIESGILRNVKGISGSRENIADHMTNGASTRKFLLVMDGAETIRLNKLSRVMYNNSKYLTSDNLSALRRLYMHDSNTLSMFGITTELRLKIRDEQRKGLLKPIQLEVAKQILNTSVIAGKSSFNRKVIDSMNLENTPFRHETQLVNAYVKLLNLPQTELWVPWLQSLISFAITKLAKTYEHEAEWLVKNELLHLPQSTRVYVTNMVEMAFPEETELWKQHYKVYNIAEHDLRNFRDKIHRKRNY